MVAKDRQHMTGSPKVEIGEIDTRAPFQSVKDAVNLFGEGAFSGGKPSIKKAKPHSAERVLAKETQLHMAQKELSKLKEQLKSAETTKSEALVELERAKWTLEELTNKLKTVNEAKESAIRATEIAKNQAKQLDEQTSHGNSMGNNGVMKQQDLETTREHYMAIITQLDAAKQQLRKIHQDCDSSTEAKSAAFKQSAEAEHTAKANAVRAGELSKEITSVQESIGQVKLATMQAQQEQAKIYAGKDVQKQSHKAALEESAKKLLALKKEINPELAKNLETKLAETESEIRGMQKEMESARDSDIDLLKTVTSELDGAKESLHKVAEEESSLKTSLETLKLELESVKKEHSELKEKEAETESIAGNLHVKLRKSKSELESACSEESKMKSASEEMVSTLHQLMLENENARKEAEEMKKQAEDWKKEAEATRIALQEAEKKLRVAVLEAEEAKAAEAKALEEIKIISERTSAARASTSESGAKITLSREEFKSLSQKVEESEKLADMKVGAAMAQVEAVKASENEALKRLEATLKEIDEMKAATEAALKRAAMAEAAKKAVEGELRRWREREQKKAAEAASRILAETEMMSSSVSSPANNYRIQKHNPNPPQKVVNVQMLEKSKNSGKPKKVLMTNLSGIFQRKKSQVDGGSSPSYLPGEKPV